MVAGAHDDLRYEDVSSSRKAENFQSPNEKLESQSVWKYLQGEASIGGKNGNTASGMDK